MQEGFAKGSSGVFRLEIHVCYKTRFCKKVFDFVEIKNRCEAIFRQVAAKISVTIKEIGFDRDHVHMDILILRTHSLDFIDKMFKGTSGRKLKREFPFLKKRPWFWGKNAGFWGEQDFGDSVGRDPTIIRNYVKNQGIGRPEKSLRCYIPPV